jgi:hypothetical protein
MRRMPLLACVMTMVAGCAAGAPEPPPYKPIADNKLLMNAVLEPAADRIWDAAGTIITLEGVTELMPKNEEEWTEVRNAAVSLAESGNLLMMVPRAMAGEDWMRMSQALVDSAAEAAKAAEAKNVQGIFDLGGEIYAVCTNCHSKYSPGISRVTQ